MKTNSVDWFEKDTFLDWAVIPGNASLAHVRTKNRVTIWREASIAQCATFKLDLTIVWCRSDQNMVLFIQKTGERNTPPAQSLKELIHFQVKDMHCLSALGKKSIQKIMYRVRNSEFYCGKLETRRIPSEIPLRLPAIFGNFGRALTSSSRGLWPNWPHFTEPI